MTGCQDDRASEGLSGVRLDAHHLLLLDDEGVHTGFKMHFATTIEDGVAHILDDTWKLVRADVRMGIYQDGGACPVLAEDIQNLIDIATLLASGVELAVRIGTGTSFAKAIIAFGVNLVFATYLGNIHLPVAYVLATFHHNGAEAMLNQAQGCKQSARASTHDDDLRLAFHILVGGAHEFLVLRKFVDVEPYFQVHINGSLAGIDAPLQYTDGLDGACIETFVLTDEQLDTLFIGCLLGQNSYLMFLPLERNSKN